MRKIILLVLGISFLVVLAIAYSERGIDSATREVDRPVREKMAEKIRIIPKPPVIEEEEEGEEEGEGGGKKKKIVESIVNIPDAVE